MERKLKLVEKGVKIMAAINMVNVIHEFIVYGVKWYKDAQIQRILYTLIMGEKVLRFVTNGLNLKIFIKI
ncbi:MAG: hypothetical protein DRJ15_14860 [Bacteroidetes bacterium]|nr:MAG: hypothetical protein DRJ15_14860 [Bacteroidota bacterium]